MTSTDTKTMYLHRTGKEAPVQRQAYDAEFKVTPAYRESLPDMMDAKDAIQGADVPIQQVGVSNFHLPLQFRTAAGKVITLQVAVTGSVSLEANLKGINMSRIIRSFYDHEDEVFTPALLERILAKYRAKVESLNARIKLSFSYPMLQESLRSNLSGWCIHPRAPAAPSYPNTPVTCGASMRSLTINAPRPA